jgi:hypothetical protein
MFDDGRPFTSDEIVIDPVVPAAARRALADMYRAGQRESRDSRRAAGPGGRVGQAGRVTRAERPRPSAIVTATTGGQLIPFRNSPPRMPPPPTPAVSRNTWTWGAFALAFLIGTLLAAVAGSIGLVVTLLAATAISTVGGVRSLFAGSSEGQAWDQEQWKIRYAAVCWHRRYVVPQTDLDDEARPTWARAVAAANEIRESYVVQRQIVDSVQVAMVLPDRLWEIAEGFAGLSQARGRQREILRQGGSDSRVAAKASAQDRQMKLEAKRLEGRVRKLEEIAGLLREADAAKRSEAMLERLGEVDELLTDLRARSAGTSVDLDPTERLRLEVQAVIDQANEAARDLALPDLGEQGDGQESSAPGSPAADRDEP